jgi:hypothetical protein
MHAVRMNFVRRNTIFDNKFLAAQITDSTQHCYGKSSTVFERSAIVVLAFVTKSACKLRRYSSFPIRQIRRGRGYFLTILEIDSSDTDRLEHMFIS